MEFIFIQEQPLFGNNNINIFVIMAFSKVPLLILVFLAVLPTFIY